VVVGSTATRESQCRAWYIHGHSSLLHKHCVFDLRHIQRVFSLISNLFSFLVTDRITTKLLDLFLLLPLDHHILYTNRNLLHTLSSPSTRHLIHQIKTSDSGGVVSDRTRTTKRKIPVVAESTSTFLIAPAVIEPRRSEHVKIFSSGNPSSLIEYHDYPAKVRAISRSEVLVFGLA